MSGYVSRNVYDGKRQLSAAAAVRHQENAKRAFEAAKKRKAARELECASGD